MHRLWAVMQATSDGYCGADRSMSGFEMCIRDSLQRKTPRLKGYDSILTNPARWAMDKFYTEGEDHT